MKLLSLALAIALAITLAACGGRPVTAPGPTPDPAAGSGSGSPAAVGCAREIAIRCATGVDGCEGGKTTEHVCVPQDASPGPLCEQEILLQCPTGQIDGCVRTPRVASRHICVFQ